MLLLHAHMTHSHDKLRAPSVLRHFGDQMRLGSCVNRLLAVVSAVQADTGAGISGTPSFSCQALPNTVRAWAV